ncbi:unnamed protein product [Linum trigynum]|uniref:Uncharacterized protein n=1 Tax=Linum trigynum TaxID=586398 RepID=A0AAV2DYR9_9ROSI
MLLLPRREIETAAKQRIGSNWIGALLVGSSSDIEKAGREALDYARDLEDIRPQLAPWIQSFPHLRAAKRSASSNVLVPSIAIIGIIQEKAKFDHPHAIGYRLNQRLPPCNSITTLAWVIAIDGSPLTFLGMVYMDGWIR